MKAKNIGMKSVLLIIKSIYELYAVQSNIIAIILHDSINLSCFFPSITYLWEKDKWYSPEPKWSEMCVIQHFFPKGIMKTLY